MKTENIKCSNCGGILVFDPKKKLLVCKYCDSFFSPKESKTNKTTNENDLFFSNLNEYHCSNCGAQLLISENSTSDTCVYCHSHITLIGRLSNEMKPNNIVPFKFSIDEAKQLFKDTSKKYRLIPSDFFKDVTLKHLQGIYYPFWNVDIDLYCDASFDAENVKSWVNGEYQYSETSYYKVYRSGHIHLEDVCSCALKDNNMNLLQGVFPYPRDSHEEFNSNYLVGFKSIKKDIEQEEAKHDIFTKAKKYCIEKLEQTITTFNYVNVCEYKHDIKKEEWYYIYFPIYLLTYIKNNKTYTYGINGYTGKIYGKFPISITKLTFFIILPILLIGSFLTLKVAASSTPDDPLYIIPLVLTLVIMITTIAFVINKYHRKKDNYNLNEFSDLDLTRSEEHHLHTTTTKKLINYKK